MENRKSIPLLCLTTLFLLIFHLSCKKESEPLPPPPLIKEIVPASAVPGDTVVIDGRKFSWKEGKNTVRFGETEAVITRNRATQLIVQVPKSLQEGQTVQVTVSTNGQTSQGKEFDVEVVDHRPLILYMYMEAFLGESLDIKGKNFGTQASECTVFFGEKKLSPKTWSPNKISIQVPNLPIGTYSVSISTPIGKSNKVECRVKKP